ncbi:nuclear transport factor 2 family protein [Yinghuangia sp. YIM S10712]|uniref:nuclear transport factor 2 family protein n=1 Tax=Yinghuangia sp. YIM S10712 TaxID=3436930 RepID=UPI003F53B4A2
MSKAVVELFFRASEREEVDTAMECFAKDGIWISPEGDEPGTTYTMDTIREYLVQQIGVLREFERQGISVDYGEFVEAGDKVYIQATVRQPDGKVLNRFVDVFTMRDGKIAIKDVFRKG